MHVLVEEGELVEVGAIVEPQRRDRSLEDRGQVLERGFAIEKGQVPARVVRHLGRVVERVGIGHQRGAPARGTQRPEFLEPGDVAHFPERRIDDVEPGPE